MLFRSTEETSTNLLPREMVDVALIVEEQIVLQSINDVSYAFALLEGRLYALNMSYSKELRYTLEVNQKSNHEHCSVHGLHYKLPQKTL